MMRRLLRFATSFEDVAVADSTLPGGGLGGSSADPVGVNQMSDQIREKMGTGERATDSSSDN